MQVSRAVVKLNDGGDHAEVNPCDWCTWIKK